MSKNRYSTIVLITSIGIMSGCITSKEQMRKENLTTLSFQAINDILYGYYGHRNSYHFCDTIPISVADTLMWRTMKYGEEPNHPHAKEIFEKIKIDKRKFIKSTAIPVMNNLNFIHESVIFKERQDDICQHYYFSPLFKVDIPDYYIQQEILHEPGLVQESVNLLVLKNGKFIIADNLIANIVWD